VEENLPTRLVDGSHQGLVAALEDIPEHCRRNNRRILRAEVIPELNGVNSRGHHPVDFGLPKLNQPIQKAQYRRLLARQVHKCFFDRLHLGQLLEDRYPAPHHIMVLPRRRQSPKIDRGKGGKSVIPCIVPAIERIFVWVPGNPKNQELPLGSPFIDAKLMISAVLIDRGRRRRRDGIKRDRVVGSIRVKQIDQLLSMNIKSRRRGMIDNRNFIRTLEFNGAQHSLAGGHHKALYR